MSHSQPQSGQLSQKSRNASENISDKNAAPEKCVVDANQGSLELGKHRLGEKVCDAPPPEKHVTPHSGEKFPFPTGQISIDKEKNVATAQAETDRNHHANPSRNPFPDEAEHSTQPSQAATASGQGKAAPTTHPAFPIKQPSKSRNGS